MATRQSDRRPCDARRLDERAVGLFAQVLRAVQHGTRRTMQSNMMPASLLVTPYAPADADELVRMWHASFEHGVGITDPHPVESRQAYLLREVVPGYTLHVARREGVIVGFMASTPETVAHLYVRVGCLGQGIGSRLLGLAKQASGGSLWLYAFSRNENACRFYQRHGFREVERESANMYKMEAIKYAWQRQAPR